MAVAYGKKGDNKNAIINFQQAADIKAKASGKESTELAEINFKIKELREIEKY